MTPTETRDGDVPLLDQWTPLSFKRALGNKAVGGRTWMQPAWVGSLNERRLQAYDVLTALADNAARYYLEGADDIRDQHREYGDAALIVSSVLAALLGDDQRIVTDGAADFDPEAEPATSPIEPGAQPPAAPVPGETDQGQARAAFEFQEWCENWSLDERLRVKLIESSRNEVIRGDGVYTIGWSDAKGRPRLRVFDPAAYFPVLDDGNEDDYPSKVHIAWEIVDEKSERAEKRKVHRLTWELIDTVETRTFPWVDGPTTKLCVFSDGIWEFDAAGKQTVEDFTVGDADWQTTMIDGVATQIFELPLNVDFVPVVHVPNSVALAAHFGRSTLANVAQILDDLSNVDTDLQASSATTGKPPIGLSNVRVAVDKDGNPIPPKYAAGAVWVLGENGKAEMIDTSSSLDALLKYQERQLERLSTNSRLPGSFLGRAKPGEVSSGIQLLLSFGPLRSMIQEMRLVRDEKLPLIFKFAHRFALQHAAATGTPDKVPARWVPTKIEFGRFLPEDTTAVVTQVTQLLGATPPAISLETAIRMLMDVGLPIDDALDEIRRIEQRDYSGAQELLAALGPQGEQHVFDYLGLEPVAPITPPPAPAAPGVSVPTPGVNPPLPPAPKPPTPPVP